MSFRSLGSIYVPLRLWDAREFEAAAGLGYGLFGLYYGILLTLFFFCVSLLVVSRLPVFAWYALYLAAACGTFAALNGVLHEFVVTQGGYPLNEGLLSLSVLTMVFALLFSRRFLELRPNVPRLDRAVRFLSAFLIL